MLKPEPAHDETYGKLTLLNFADPEHVRICKDKIIQMIKYFESTSNWKMVEPTLLLIDKDLGTIIESINQYEYTDKEEEYNNMLNEVFDSKPVFIDKMQEIRTKIGEVAVELSNKKKMGETLKKMNTTIPGLMRNALKGFKETGTA